MSLFFIICDLHISTIVELGRYIFIHFILKTRFCLRLTLERVLTFGDSAVLKFVCEDLYITASC